MNWQRIWNDPVWSKVIAVVIVSVGSLAYALVPKDPLGLGVVFGVILLGVALLAWTFFRAPVAWNFDGFLGMVGGGGELRVISFQATGRNRSGKGFHDINGHLVSNIDNSLSEQLHFVIGGTPVLPSSTTGIPPGATFQIVIPLCDMTKGYDAYLKEYEFLQRWSAFRFVVELDGYRDERVFSQRRVSEQIESFRRVANPRPEPQVRARL